MEPWLIRLITWGVIVVWFSLASFGLGVSFERWRLARLAKREQLEQLSKHVAQGLRPIRGGH